MGDFHDGAGSLGTSADGWLAIWRNGCAPTDRGLLQWFVAMRRPIANPVKPRDTDHDKGATERQKRVLRAFIRFLERYVGRPFDAVVSMELDKLHAEEDGQ